ncbi:hypothetical protein HQN84_00115 [Pedobacter steynii]|nr:hypothetical protein [Pedobacter steynii]NQX37223.1 hypothetical protein [Pedobacter steynii]
MEQAKAMDYKHASHFTSAFQKYFGYLLHKIKMLMLVFDPEFYLVLFPIS